MKPPLDTGAEPVTMAGLELPAGDGFALLASAAMFESSCASRPEADLTAPDKADT